MAYLERVKMRVVRLWRELVHRFGEFVKVILRLARQDQTEHRHAKMSPCSAQRDQQSAK